MADKVKKGDFVQVNYTGKLTDGTVFDTTVEAIAKEKGLFNPKITYKPVEICIGEQQLLPGLDAKLEGQEVGTEFTVTLPPEEAFGKRDVKNMRIVPMDVFKEHKVQPQAGLEINMDGQRGIVSRVSGGRVIVNFNHPLAGREVEYTVKIEGTITDTKEKILTYITSTLRFPKGQMKVDLQGDKAVIELPMEMPAQITDILVQKVVELAGVKDVEFKGKVPLEKKE